MLSMFAFLGQFLDRTKLNFEKKERFLELEKLYNKNLGGIGLSFVLLVFSFLSILAVWHMSTNPPPSVFLMKDEEKTADSTDGKMVLKKMITSRSPRMSDVRMQNWARGALLDTYTFNFNNVDEQLKIASIAYRPDTFEKMMSQFYGKKGLVTAVKENSLVVSLTPSSEVKVLRAGKTPDGMRVWEVEMSASIYLSGALKEIPPPEKKIFVLFIQEVSPTINPYGFVISQINQKVG